MSRYEGGANAERELKAALELAYPGCLVIRSAGSHGIADLVMLDTYGDATVIQAKASRGAKHRLLADALKEVRSEPFIQRVSYIAAVRSHGHWTLYEVGNVLHQELQLHSAKIRTAVAQLRAKRRGKAA